MPEVQTQPKINLEVVKKKPIFVMFTYDGSGLPIAYKLQQEGYKVYVGQVKELPSIKEKDFERERRLRLYDGLLEKEDAVKLTNALLRVKNKEDYFIICDFNNLYEVANVLRKAGFSGLLPSKGDYELEKDRELAKEFIESRYDIFAKEEHYEFHKIDEAIQFLQNNNDKVFVVKGFHPDAPTIVPVSNIPEEANIEIIFDLKENRQIYEKMGFILEEKIPDLIEFIPEAIVYNKKILGFNVDIELKPIGPANTGFQTGCSADVVMWLDLSSKLYDWFIKPAEDYIMRKNQLVIWDAGVMYSPSRDRFYFSEFCSNRWGYNSIFTELSSLPSVGYYFEKIIREEPIFSPQVKPFGTSLRLFALYEESIEKIKPMPILTDINDKDVWLWDVQKIDDLLLTVGHDINIAVLTNSGYDWQESFKELFTKIGKVKFAEMYYRSLADILDDSYVNNLTTRINFVKMLDEKEFNDVEIPVNN